MTTPDPPTVNVTLTICLDDVHIGTHTTTSTETDTDTSPPNQPSALPPSSSSPKKSASTPSGRVKKVIKAEPEKGEGLEAWSYAARRHRNR
ncbi:hypothetical protein FOMPIDRAFT_87263 [Fomitopsis schrenkii]|uniref:Uncharacterized protein n=1 Tax=Fomitopsis schrenkii TaxID=2126942 RepID=S8FB00_FOMSC|nr:hypothetical protein FOMPIDRAFT_87263 [Fomitopsis schrenkii]